MELNVQPKLSQLLEIKNSNLETTAILYASIRPMDICQVTLEMNTKTLKRLLKLLLFMSCQIRRTID